MRPPLKRHGVSTGFLWALVLGLPTRAQDPAPRQVALERWFFASPGEVQAAITGVAGLLTRLEATRARFASAPGVRARADALEDSIWTEARRVMGYFHLRAAIDNRDLASARLEDSLDAEVTSRTAWLQATRVHPDPAHTLPEAQATLLEQLRPLATGWQFPLWQRLAPGDRETRAYVLLETVRSHDALARRRGYASAPDEVYAGRGLTTDQVRSLIALVRSKAQLYRRFLTLNAERASLGDTPLVVQLDSVAPILSEALRPLGDAYGRELRALFDPAQERIDLRPGANRLRGGFSTLSPGKASLVYLDGYAGALRDFSRLTHESAHALHRTLMDTHGVPQVYRDGPLLMEPIALFNELVAADRLYTRATNEAERRQTLAQFLYKAFEVFHGAQDAELEQAIYDGVESGRVQSANDLDSLTKEVNSAYALVPVGGYWMGTSLLVEDPLYLSNYLYSGMIVLAWYGAFLENPAGFGARYVGFLSNGFHGTPYDIVRETLGVDLTRSDVLDRGLTLLEQRLAEFSRLVERR